MRRKSFIALSIFGFLILVLQIGFYFYKNNSTPEAFPVEFIADDGESKIALSEFNPNDLNAKQWKDLGFTEKQIKTILKYKDIVGGEFASKEQISKCYAISEEKFKEIEPYILLPFSTKNTNKKYDNNYSSAKNKQLNISKKFNPDHFSVKDWQNIGFSEKQAQAILKYKDYLGGGFRSKEKFKECFIISEQNYSQLAPFIILPEKEEKTSSTAKTKTIQYNYFDPNNLDLKGWIELGFSEKQAENILKYKNNYLKGSFKNLEDIQKCYMISQEKFEQLKPWIRLKTEEKITEKSNKTSTNFSEVDVNSINFNQLKEFGFDDKQAASILGFRKALGGFIKKEQILETYNVDKNLAQKLISTTNLNEKSISKYSLKDFPESDLKRHPYFKKYAERIIFLRVSYTSDSEIFKKLKANKEDEMKMRLYLK